MGGINLDEIVHALNRSVPTFGSGSHVNLKAARPDKRTIFIDAGVGFIRLSAHDGNGDILLDRTVPSGRGLGDLFGSHDVQTVLAEDAQASIYITGKLAALVNAQLGRGKTILPAAASCWAPGT